LRKPRVNKLRMLTAVADGRVRRTGQGWVYCAQPAASADARMLTTARDDGWISVAREPIDPLESVDVTLTGAGRGVLTRYWPEWSPRERD
jgi:hypothetical protein